MHPVYLQGDASPNPHGANELLLTQTQIIDH